MPCSRAFRERADRLRRVPLEAVLLLSGAEQDRRDRAKWRTAQGVLSVSGAKFMNWHHEAGGGGAIDLVMHLHGLGFSDALEWLGRHFPRYLPPEPPAPQRRHGLRLPAKDPGKLARVMRYLHRDRSVPSSLTQPLVAAGTLYADVRGNAVFLLLGKENRPVGAELRGTTQRSWRGMAPGSRKDEGYFSVTPPHAAAVVLCESAIDALSCAALHTQCLCVSTSGARANPRWLPALLTEGRPVYCGFDGDPTGDTTARAMLTRYPGIRRLRPALHDWNDLLRSRSPG